MNYHKFIEHLNEFERLIKNGYTVSDISLIFNTHSHVVDYILSLSQYDKLTKISQLKNGKTRQLDQLKMMTDSRINQISNDVISSRLDQRQFMLKYDIPISLHPELKKILISKHLTKHDDFIENSKYFNNFNLFKKQYAKLNSEEKHEIKSTLSSTYDVSESTIFEILQCFNQFYLSCSEISLKYDIDVDIVKIIVFTYYNKTSNISISEEDILDRIYSEFSIQQIKEILIERKTKCEPDFVYALKLNCPLLKFSKILSHLLKSCNIDSNKYKNDVKTQRTQLNLQFRFGNQYKNVAQLEHVKTKTSETINSIRYPMTRKLKTIDDGPEFYQFSNMSTYTKFLIIQDLIMNKGYRAEDIVLISDIEDTHEITNLNQSYHAITQLTTADYQLRINAQLNRFINLSNEEHQQLVDLLKSQQVSSKKDACVVLKLPFRAFDSKIKFSSTDKIYVENDRLHLPIMSTKKLSKYERSVVSFLKSLDLDIYLHNKSILNGFEIDIFIPKLNVGIEINPQFTHHSNQVIKDNLKHRITSKEKDYHYKKYLLAKEKHIKLIQLYEWDFVNQSLSHRSINRLTSILKPICKLYARKCHIKELDVKTAKEFLNLHHTNGYARSLYKYGLYHNDELVAVATFSSSTSKQYDLELKRLAFKSGYRVIGGTSKFIKHVFRSHSEISSIYSYSDNDWGDGNSYKKSGFEFVSETGPSLKYVSNSNPEDTYSWQITSSVTSPKSVIGHDRLTKGLSLELNYDVEEYIETSLSHRLDNKSGYDRIYTSGSKKWSISRSSFNKKKDKITN